MEHVISEEMNIENIINDYVFVENERYFKASKGEIKAALLKMIATCRGDAELNSTLFENVIGTLDNTNMGVNFTSVPSCDAFLAYRINVIVSKDVIKNYENFPHILSEITFRNYYSNTSTSYSSNKFYYEKCNKNSNLEFRNSNLTLPWMGTFHSICVKILKKYQAPT